MAKRTVPLERSQTGATPEPPLRKTGQGPDRPQEKGSTVVALPKRDSTISADTYKTWETGKKEAKRKRDPWVKVWQEVYDYCLPNREGFYDVPPGANRTDMIYDETAVQALPRLASRLTSGYFPEYGEIFSLAPGQDAPDYLKGPEGQAKFDELTMLIHQCWQNSNFFSEVSEGLVDFAIGTMNMCQEEGPFPMDLSFKAVPPTHLAILPGAGSSVRGWFQWRKTTLEDLRLEQPKAEFTERMTADLKREPRREITVDYATWETSTPGHPSWKHVVIVEAYKAAIIERKLEGEGACPWTTTRWAKTGFDVWGRGNVLNTMPAIKTCNLTVQMILENAELALGGVWTYDDDGVFNPDNIVLRPGTFIPKGIGSKVEAMVSPARFDVAQLVLQDMRMNIKKGLFVDEMDTPGKTPRSAYEIQSRLAEVARDLSAPGGRVVRECLVPNINRTIYILDKQGVLESLGLRVDGKRVKFRVKSPFLRGQDQIELTELLTGSQQIDAIFGPGTGAMTFKMEPTVAFITEKNGISPRLLNSKADVQAMMNKGAADAAAGGAIGGENGMDPAALAGVMQGGGG